MPADWAAPSNSAGITAVSLLEFTKVGKMTVCLPGAFHKRTSPAVRPSPVTVTGTAALPAVAAAGATDRITGEI